MDAAEKVAIDYAAELQSRLRGETTRLLGTSAQESEKAYCKERLKVLRARARRGGVAERAAVLRAGEPEWSRAHALGPAEGVQQTRELFRGLLFSPFPPPCTVPARAHPTHLSLAPPRLPQDVMKRMLRRNLISIPVFASDKPYEFVGVFDSGHFLAALNAHIAQTGVVSVLRSAAASGEGLRGFMGKLQAVVKHGEHFLTSTPVGAVCSWGNNGCFQWAPENESLYRTICKRFLANDYV